MDTFRIIQNQLGSIPLDGVVITFLTYILSPEETKVRNFVIIGSSHWALHGMVCKIQNENGLI